MTADLSAWLRDLADVCSDLRPVGAWPGEKAAARLRKAASALDSGRKDKARLDWLADRDNAIGNVQLPTAAALAHPECMRAAIDAAMEMPQDWPKDDDL